MKRIISFLLVLILVVTQFTNHIYAYTTNYNPTGCIDIVTTSSGSVTVGGWAFDKDSSSTSINVNVYIGSICIGTLNANSERPDVNSVYGITGNHGFCGTLSTKLSGSRTITIKAVNVGSGVEYTIGSKTVNIPSTSTDTGITTKYDPKANIEAVTATAGSIKIAGWAYDPDDASQSISVKAYIGSTCLGTISANIARADVNSAFSISGKHGFSGTLSTTLSGTQTVTIKAVDLESNIEYIIGSKSVTIPSTTNNNPIGNVEAVTATLGSITIGGWAYDPDDASQSISVKAYIGSTCLGTVNTTVARSDVNSKFSISGNHGFSGKLSTTLTGTQTVTIKAVNLSDNKEYTIGSKSVSIPSSYTTKYNPIGNVEAVTVADGSIKIAGWAYDPDSASQSISVKAYVGSICLGTLSANIARPDVNSAFSISGNHGFSGKLSTTLTGTQTVTIKAVDLGSGAEYAIGYKSVAFSSSYTTKYDPKGNVEAVTAVDGSITIAGWAYDPDEASQSISVKAYIGSTCLGTLSANIARPDVNSAFSISGNHGFSGKLSTTLSGTQTVTIKAVNLGTGSEHTIGSKSVTIPSSYTTKYDPKGNVEAITADTGSITIAGWAYDPDNASQSISVKAYIGSTCLGTVNANIARADVNSTFSISGNHGFSGKLSTTLSGTYTVTIKAINLGTGNETTIGSKTVTIPSNKSTTYTTNYNPNGCIDFVTATKGSIKVGGWAFDKDESSTSIYIKVYVGSTCLDTIYANQTRDDVNKAYSISGEHGFSGTISTTLTGTITVTIKALNLGSNVEYTIGSKNVTISNTAGVTLMNTSKTVIIDAGHGGSDPGCSSGNLVEKNITLTYALAVGKYLTSQGINVVYTRDGDYELTRSSYVYNGTTYTNDLTARAALGYQYNAALYCSIHIDSYSSSSHGFSCFYNPKYSDSLDLANMILANLSAIGYTQNRGLLDGTRLRSIRGNSTISVMVELGFIQSSDITYIMNNVPTISQAIGNAIIQKLNKGWLEPTTTIVPDLS